MVGSGSSSHNEHELLNYAIRVSRLEMKQEIKETVCTTHAMLSFCSTVDKQQEKLVVCGLNLAGLTGISFRH